jgi:hypothetical protein
MRWGVPKQKRHCAAYGGISHRVIIIQKQKDFVIDVGQVTYQHRHDRMRMEQQAVSPLVRMWLGEAPIGLMIEVMRVPEVEVADLRSPSPAAGKRVSSSQPVTGCTGRKGDANSAPPL